MWSETPELCCKCDCVVDSYPDKTKEDIAELVKKGGKKNEAKVALAGLQQVAIEDIVRSKPG